MPGTNGTTARIPVRRLAILTAALAPVVLIFVITVYWIIDHVPTWYYWKAGLIFLIALEVTYWLAAVLALLGVFVLGACCSAGARPGATP